MKEIVFLGSSLADLRDFPDIAKREAGFDLSQIQHGHEPSDWKPMPDIGKGVKELRIRVGGAFRVIYLENRPETVYVLHCFQKKSQKTAKYDIDLAKQRFKQIGA